MIIARFRDESWNGIANKSGTNKSPHFDYKSYSEYFNIDEERLAAVPIEISQGGGLGGENRSRIRNEPTYGRYKNCK
jgi:hypothetical protein